MIEGEYIRLRAWQESDVALMTALRNDVDLQAQLLARVRGSQAAQVRDWMERRSTEADSIFFIIADSITDSALGYVQLTGIDLVDRRAELGICLDRAAQGRGSGREALELLMPYVREACGLRKLSLRVRADNVAAIRCYEYVGFEHCGLLRQHVFINDAWTNIVLMEIFLGTGN